MSVVFDGPAQVNGFRMMTLRSGLRLEGVSRKNGKVTMKLTRGPLCSTRVREEFGDMGGCKARDYADQYDRFNALCVAYGLPDAPREGWDNTGKVSAEDMTPVTPYRLV